MRSDLLGKGKCAEEGQNRDAGRPSGDLVSKRSWHEILNFCGKLG